MLLIAYFDDPCMDLEDFPVGIVEYLILTTVGLYSLVPWHLVYYQDQIIVPQVCTGVWILMYPPGNLLVVKAGM